MKTRDAVAAAAAVLALVTTSCLSDLSVPPDAVLKCASNDECPKPLVCAVAAKKCVDPSVVNLEPLRVDVDDAGAHVRMSRTAPFDTNTVRFRFNRAPVQFVATIDDVAVDCADVDAPDGADAGAVFKQCTYAAPDGDDGEKTLQGTATDEVGAQAFARAPFFVDTKAPAVIEELIRITYVPGAGNPRAGAIVTSSTVGTTVHVSLAFDEPVAETPSVTLDGPDPAADTLLDEGPAAPTSVVGASFLDEGAVADGAYALIVEAVDDVGNRAVSSTGANIAIDHTSPSPPSTESDAVVLRRFPWGAPEGDGAARAFVTAHASVEGAPGSVDDDVRLVRSLALGHVVGDGEVENGGAGEGTFTVPLVVADARTVEVVAYDDAGNASAPALVKNVEWTASFGDKVPGSTFENPHSASVVRDLSPALFGAPLTETLDPAALTLADGDVVTASFARSWRFITPSLAPVARANAIFAYDSARDTFVASCGSLATDIGSDTFELAHDKWTERSIASPPARTAAASAYDALTGRVVAFGGLAAGAAVDETWEYDGVAWQQRAVGGPPPRTAASMVYDVDDGVIVMFGGRIGNGGANTVERDDTWLYDGAAWTPGPSGTDAPPARSSAAMAYDEERHRVVLMGGFSDGPLGDTWAFAGGAWTQLPSGPSARQSAGMAFDPASRDVILFGGSLGTFDGTPRSSELWHLGDAGWSLIPDDGGPRPDDRLAFAMATDGARGRVLLFSGIPEDAGAVSGILPLVNDTWDFDGVDNTWHKESPLTSQQGDLDPAALAFDPARGELLSYAGQGIGAGVFITNELIRFDGEVWTRPTTATQPPAATNAGFAPLGSGMLAVANFGSEAFLWNGDDWSSMGPLPSVSAPFALATDVDVGGTVNTGRVLLSARGAATDDETWTFNGRQWSLVCNGAGGDACPAAGSLATDRARGVVVAVDDTGTWEWDGAAWTTTLDAAAGPPVSDERQLTFDPDRSTVVLVVGGGDLSTWEYDGAAWSELDVAALPTPRTTPNVAYDEAHHALTLVGGIVSGHTVGETWTLSGAGRPAVLLRFVLAAAGVGDATLVSADVNAAAGGSGPGGAARDGVELLAWRHGRFESLATSPSTSSLTAPAPLAAHLEGTDLALLPFGVDDSLFFAVAPIDVDERKDVASTVAVDEATVTVRYRLP